METLYEDDEITVRCGTTDKPHLENTLFIETTEGKSIALAVSNVKGIIPVLTKWLAIRKKVEPFAKKKAAEVEISADETEVITSKVDGYNYAERLLEGVMFAVKFLVNHTRREVSLVSVEPADQSDRDYLNKQKLGVWTKEIRKQILESESEMSETFFGGLNDPLYDRFEHYRLITAPKASKIADRHETVMINLSSPMDLVS